MRSAVLPNGILYERIGAVTDILGHQLDGITVERAVIGLSFAYVPTVARGSPELERSRVLVCWPFDVRRPHQPCLCASAAPARQSARTHAAMANANRDRRGRWAASPTLKLPALRFAQIRCCRPGGGAYRPAVRRIETAHSAEASRA